MQYGDEEDADSFGFDNDPQYADYPPLDYRRKVRREIMKTINELREKFQHPSVNLDPLTNRAADAYAEFLLRESENEEALSTICEEIGSDLRHTAHPRGRFGSLYGLAACLSVASDEYRPYSWCAAPGPCDLPPRPP